MINCFRVGKLSSVGSQGRVGVSVGGMVLLGHLHGWSACVGTPLLEQEGVVEEGAVGGGLAMALAIVAGGQLPMDGKF